MPSLRHSTHSVTTHQPLVDKCRRYRRLIGRNHWKSSYNNTAEPLEKERRRKMQATRLKPPRKLVA